MTPDPTHVGEKITINATNFGASETVNVISDLFQLTIQTDSGGAGSTTFTIPLSETQGMTYNVHGYELSGKSAYNSFAIR